MDGWMNDADCTVFHHWQKPNINMFKQFRSSYWNACCRLKYHFGSHWQSIVSCRYLYVTDLTLLFFKPSLPHTNLSLHLHSYARIIIAFSLSLLCVICILLACGARPQGSQPAEEETCALIVMCLKLDWSCEMNIRFVSVCYNFPRWSVLSYLSVQHLVKGNSRRQGEKLSTGVAALKSAFSRRANTLDVSHCSTSAHFHSSSSQRSIDVACTLKSLPFQLGLFSLTSHLYQSPAPIQKILVLSNQFYAFDVWFIWNRFAHTLMFCWWICLWSACCVVVPDIRRVWQTHSSRPVCDSSESMQFLSSLQRFSYKVFVLTAV